MKAHFLVLLSKYLQMACGGAFTKRIGIDSSSSNEEDSVESSPSDVASASDVVSVGSSSPDVTNAESRSPDVITIESISTDVINIESISTDVINIESISTDVINIESSSTDITYMETVFLDSSETELDPSVSSSETKPDPSLNSSETKPDPSVSSSEIEPDASLSSSEIELGPSEMPDLKSSSSDAPELESADLGILDVEPSILDILDLKPDILDVLDLEPSPPKIPRLEPSPPKVPRLEPVLLSTPGVNTLRSEPTNLSTPEVNTPHSEPTNLSTPGLEIDGFPNSLCNSCFSKASAHFSSIVASSGSKEAGPNSNFQSLNTYLKTLNSNHNCYMLAKNGRYKDAIKVLFESGQKQLFSSIYDLKFKSENEMRAFRVSFEAYSASIDHPQCGSRIEDALKFFNEVMGQVFYEASLQPPKHNNSINRHAKYYAKYHEFINTMYDSGQLMACLKTLLKQIRASTVQTMLLICIPFQFYDALLPRLAQAKSLTSEVVIKALYTFVYDDRRPYRTPFKIISLQPVHAFASYQARNEAAHAAVINNLLRAILLNEDVLAAEGVDSLLRVYTVHGNLPLPLFIDYAILVHRIIAEHSTISNDEERDLFLSLHRNLVADLLSSYNDKSLSIETLLSLEKLRSSIPLLSGAVAKIEQSCVITQFENANAVMDFLNLLHNFWRAGDFQRMVSLLSKLRTIGRQALILLKAISIQNFEISFKVPILCELVKCDVLNAYNSDYIMQNLDNSDPDLTITYSLALISYAYRAKQGARIEKPYVLGTYLKLSCRYLPIFTYADGPHSSEYYVLHAYDIFFNYNYSHNEEMKAFWNNNVFVNYQLNYFTSLWSTLKNISNWSLTNHSLFNSIYNHSLLNSTSNNSTSNHSTQSHSLFNNTSPADGNDLLKMKLWSFRMLKFYSQANSNLNLLNPPVYDLLKSKQPLSDIYIHYFGSDPQYVNYLIQRYFYYISKAKCKEFGFKINCQYISDHRPTVIEYLKTRATSLLSVIRSGSKITELQAAIRNTCVLLSEWGVIKAIDCCINPGTIDRGIIPGTIDRGIIIPDKELRDIIPDKELRELTEKMIIDISNVLYRNGNYRDPLVSIELQIAQAFRAAD